MIVETATLESQSLWHKYKTQVWLEESEQTAVVHNVMRVLRAFRNTRNLAYVSVPITSGRFLYNLRLERPLMKKDAQVKAAIEHNYSAGWDFVEDLEKRTSFPILYPADLIPVHQQWEQAHFQALWLSIIAEKCTEVHMSAGWEFSNGGSEEFAHVWQLKLGLPRHPDLVFYNTKETEESERERMRNIKVFDHMGRLMTIDDGIWNLRDSLAWLKENNFEAKTLENCLQLLLETRDMLNAGVYY